MVQTALAPHPEAATIADSPWVAQTADHILSVIEASRSTWQMWQVWAEAQRQVRTTGVSAQRAGGLVDLLVDEVLQRRSIALARGARLQLAIAPAGAGKTTAMRALTLAWTQDGGQVIGLAPSAAAAAVLAAQTGIRTDTLAKFTWSLNHGRTAGLDGSGWTVDSGDHR
jgi:ABC-type uncharacterized transport system ATPase subunit